MPGSLTRCYRLTGPPRPPHAHRGAVARSPLHGVLARRPPWPRTRQPLTGRPPQRNEGTYLTCFLPIRLGSQMCDSGAHITPVSNSAVFFKKVQKQANNGIQVRPKI